MSLLFCCWLLTFERFYKFTNSCKPKTSSGVLIASIIYIAPNSPSCSIGKALDLSLVVPFLPRRLQHCLYWKIDLGKHSGIIIVIKGLHCQCYLFESWLLFHIKNCFGYLSKFTLLNNISAIPKHVQTGNYTIVVSFLSFPHKQLSALNTQSSWAMAEWAALGRQLMV